MRMVAVHNKCGSNAAPSAVSLALLILFSLTALAGCQASPKHYTLRGHVLSKNQDTQQLTINHDAVPGFMPAMAMSYQVKDLQGLDQVEPGDQVTADVVVANADTYWLDQLKITDSSGRAAAVPATQAQELQVGKTVADVPLTNQDGQTLHLRQFKGKAVLVTFIYTRCPLPTFCPLISSEFAAIQNQLQAAPSDFARTHLVSISLDPSYDKPPVLRKYGLAYLADNPEGFKHWDFVSTSPADLQKLASAFGLEFYEQDNQIAHSMETVLLAPDGTVAQSWPGNEWKTDEVLAAMRKAERQNE
jgi:protein SCO1/2